LIQSHRFSTAGFDPERALAWRNTNYALGKSIEVFEHVRAQMEGGYDVCMAVCIIPVTPLCAHCVVPSILESIMESLLFALALALDVSEHVYAEIVKDQDDAAKDEIPSAIYENVITIHGNIIVTHTMLSTVYNIVTGIKNKVGARRRLELIDCFNTTLGYVDNCSKPSCEDPTRYCDGSFNYEYISHLESGENFNKTMGRLCIPSHHMSSYQIVLFFFSLAGCDGLDSDGDGQVDYCEDQYPPELVVRNAESFQCDYKNSDASKYCYTAVVFKDEKQVKMFLRDNFVVIDDCPATELDMEIKKIGGTCKNTHFMVKPFQDTGCAPGLRGERNITHVNPLDGIAEEVTVYLDESPPRITCGFNHAPHVSRNNSVSTNGKTLYHRLGNSVGSRLKLNNADFFYTVNVSSPHGIKIVKYCIDRF
jgi:hypothetical protein